MTETGIITLSFEGRDTEGRDIEGQDIAVLT